MECGSGLVLSACKVRTLPHAQVATWSKLQLVSQYSVDTLSLATCMSPRFRRAGSKATTRSYLTTEHTCKRIQTIRKYRSQYSPATKGPYTRLARAFLAAMRYRSVFRVTTAFPEATGMRVVGGVNLKWKEGSVR